MYRILVVDNEPYVVDWIAFLIETKSRQEVDVCRAYTAKEALQWLAKTRIDVLVSDISMPGMDGLELAGIVKEQWPYAKVVLITVRFVLGSMRFPASGSVPAAAGGAARPPFFPI